MINIKPGILAELKTISGVLQVCREFPKDFSKMPTITYNIDENSMNARSGGIERLTNMSFQIEVWADNASAGSVICAAVDAIFTPQGLDRTSYNDIEDPSGLNHSVMRYGGIIDVKSMIVHQ